MRSVIRNRRSAATLSVAITPMIDVVFLLLVFFLCTASFQIPEEDLTASLLVETDAQGAGSPREAPPLFDEIELTGRQMGAKTLWSVNRGPETAESAALAALLVELARIDRAAPVTIEADEEVPLGAVIRAYDAARSASFAKVRLAASAESIDRSGTASAAPDR